MIFNRIPTYFIFFIVKSNKIIYSSIFKNHKNYEPAIKELYKLIISKNSYIELIWTFLGYISGLYLYIMYLEDHNYFKIVGTYDQNIEEFEKISDILNFKKIIADEDKKIQDKLGKQDNIESIENV